MFVFGGGALLHFDIKIKHLFFSSGIEGLKWDSIRLYEQKKNMNDCFISYAYTGVPSFMEVMGMLGQQIETRGFSVRDFL